MLARRAISVLVVVCAGWSAYCIAGLPQDSGDEPKAKAVDGDSPLPAEPPGREQPAGPAADAGRELFSPNLSVLDFRVDVAFDDEELLSAIDSLAKQSGANILVDRQALRDEGGVDGIAVDLQARQIRLEDAFDLLLPGHGLDYYFTRSGIVVTTYERAESQRDTRVYDVADLVESASGSAPEDGTGGSLPGVARPARSESNALFETLESIDRFGNAVIHQSSDITALIVTQPWRKHRETAAILAQLRAARSPRHAAATPHRAAVSPSTAGLMLAGLAADEELVVLYRMSACFSFAKYEIVLTGATPGVAKGWKIGGSAESPVKVELPVVRLDRDDLRRLNNLLAYARHGTRGVRTSVNHDLKFVWRRGGQVVAEESFADDTAAFEPYIMSPGELAHRFDKDFNYGPHATIGSGR